MKKNTLISFFIVFIAILTGAASFSIPVPLGDGPWLRIHMQLAVGIIMGVFYLGAAILFLTGLKKFTSQLKVAYIFICIGFFLLAIAQIQIPLFQALSAWDNSWVSHGGILVPYIVAGLAILMGTRKFSRLVDTKTVLNSWLIIITIITITTVLLYFGRQVIYPYREGVNILTGLPFVLTLIPPVMFAIATAHILKIKQKTSVLYTHALMWFFIAMSTVTIAQFQVVIFSTIGFDFFGSTQGYLQLILGEALSGLMLIKAAHAFNTINIYNPAYIDSKNNTTSLDIVMYAANLASNPNSIEPYRERLREITAKITPGQKDFSQEIQSSLKNLYLEMEEYLIEKEPVKKITKYELRKNIIEKLKLQEDTGTTFWPELH